MSYPKSSESKIKDWELDNLVVNEYFQRDVPLEVSQFVKKDNTIIFINGVIKFNNTTISNEKISSKLKNSNKLTSYNDQNGLSVGLKITKEFSGKQINIINFISNSDLCVDFIYEVDKFVEVKITEFLFNKDISKINQKVFVHANESSKIQFVSINSLLPKSKAYYRFDSSSKKDSEINMVFGNLSGDFFLDINSNANEQGAVIDTKVVSLVNKSFSQNVLIKSVNKCKYTSCNIDVYGISMDNAHLVVDGIGKIEKGMIKSKAFQKSKILIIGEKAAANVNPLLLIDEHDVEAGHGATVGKIDEDHLYYMMSRGVSKLEASKLIIEGYINYLYNEISDDDILNSVKEKLSINLRDN